MYNRQIIFDEEEIIVFSILGLFYYNLYLHYNMITRMKFFNCYKISLFGR